MEFAATIIADLIGACLGSLGAVFAKSDSTARRSSSERGTPGEKPRQRITQVQNLPDWSPTEKHMPMLDVSPE